MERNSEFVRPADVLDPDNDPNRTGEVDYDHTGSPTRRAAVTLICIAGVILLAALQPHARNFDSTAAPAASGSAVRH